MSEESDNQGNSSGEKDDIAFPGANTPSVLDAIKRKFRIGPAPLQEDDIFKLLHEDGDKHFERTWNKLTSESNQEKKEDNAAFFAELAANAVAEAAAKYKIGISKAKIVKALEEMDERLERPLPGPSGMKDVLGKMSLTDTASPTSPPVPVIPPTKEILEEPKVVVPAQLLQVPQGLGEVLPGDDDAKIKEIKTSAILPPVGGGNILLGGGGAAVRPIRRASRNEASVTIKLQLSSTPNPLRPARARVGPSTAEATATVSTEAATQKVSAPKPESRMVPVLGSASPTEKKAPSIAAVPAPLETTSSSTSGGTEGMDQQI